MKKISWILMLIALVLMSSCRDKDCSCPTKKSSTTKFRNAILSNVDEAKDVAKVILNYDDKGSPLVAVLQDQETLNLYVWQSGGWEKFTVLSGVLICDVDFTYLGNSQVLFLVTVGTDDTYSCNGEEVVYDYSSQQRKINQNLSLLGIDYINLRKLNDVVFLSYVVSDSLTLKLGTRSHDKWIFETVDPGGAGGVGMGNIAYTPKIFFDDNNNIALAYYEMRAPDIKFALYSNESGNWRYKIVPIQSKDIKVTPDFDAIFAPWGGIGVVFRNSVNNNLYYAFETTGWDIGEITDGNEATGFKPFIFYKKDKILTLFYNLTRKQMQLAYNLTPFFNKQGIEIKPWKVELLPLDNFGLTYDVKVVPNENLIGIVYYNEKDEEVEYREVLY